MVVRSDLDERRTEEVDGFVVPELLLLDAPTTPCLHRLGPPLAPHDGAEVRMPSRPAAASIRSSYVTSWPSSDPNRCAVARWIASRVRSSHGSSVAAATSTRSLIRASSISAKTDRPAATAAVPAGRSARSTSARASALETSGRRRRRWRLRAADSGSATASFTIADESRYVRAISAHRGGGEPTPGTAVPILPATPAVVEGR